jgi:hypothetical protein
MRRDPGPMDIRKPLARARLSNGTQGCVLPGIDQRSAVARRFRDVIAAVVSDLGGPSNVTELRLHLIRRFAAIVVQVESMEARMAEGHEIDVSRHNKSSSVMARLAHRIGLRRVSKNVTPVLRDYLDAEAAP